MKTAFRKVILIIMTIILVFSSTACDKYSGEIPKEQGSVIEYMKDVTNGEVLNLVNNGQTKYKIVIPSGAGTICLYAAQELQNFIKSSSTCSIPIVSDATISDFRETNYYISIGETKICEEHGVDVYGNNLGTDGTIIKNIGNLVLLFGETDYGTLFSVYDFLGQEIDFEAYTMNELYYVEKNIIPIVNFKEFKNIPDIEYRTTSSGGIFASKDVKAALRMRMRPAGGSGGRDFFGTPYFGFWAESAANLVLPASKYAAEHPTWYTNGQLCMSNEEMVEAFIERFIQLITKDYATHSRFQLGHADIAGYCSCQNCQEAYEKYGGAGGLYMVFLNRISDATKAYFESIGSDRQVEIWALAYKGYQTAPAVYDEETKTYKPVCEEVVARDNVYVMYAPIYSCWAHPFDDASCPTNAEHYASLQGWAACTDHLGVWTYEVNYNDYMQYYNDWGSVKRNAEIFTDLDVEYIFGEGGGAGGNGMYGGNFYGLRGYLRSKLLWDNSLDVNVLIDNFMTNYYKVAAPAVKKAFYSILLHYDTTVKTLSGLKGCACSFNSMTDYSKAEYWPYEYLVSLENIFDEAFVAIENSSYDAEMKETLYSRVLQDELSARYYLLNMYSNYYSSSKLEEYNAKFKADCTRAGITAFSLGFVGDA